MIIIKQQHREKPKWKRDKNPSNRNIPEIYYPVARLSRIESLSGRHKSQICVFQTSWNMRKTNPEERWEDVSIVCEDSTKPWFPEHTVAKFLKSVYRSEKEDTYYA